MDPIIKDIQKTMKVVAPILNHHMDIAGALNRLSEHFTDIGMKLKGKYTPEQKKKYEEVTQSYVVVRDAVAQNFIFEQAIKNHEHNDRIRDAKIAEQAKEIESLRKQIEFLQ